MDYNDCFNSLVCCFNLFIYIFMDYNNCCGGLYILICEDILINLFICTFNVLLVCTCSD